MISLENVHYRYPDQTTPALNGISLEIGTGELVAIVGANGAGKSTLCYAIAGFVPQHFGGSFSGSVTVAGRNTRETPLGELVQHCGLVFSNPLNQISGARYTVRGELAFGLENLGVPRAEMVTRIDAMLRLLDIEALAERSPLELSGGQQQRVAIASIMVMQPAVLILDEPTSQLDPLGTRDIIATLRALSDSGTTIVLVEHKPELIAAFAERVLVLHEGQIVRDGLPHAVLADPALPALGVTTARYTALGQAALARQLWPAATPLPVTLDDAVAGFCGADA